MARPVPSPWQSLSVFGTAPKSKGITFNTVLLKISNEDFHYVKIKSEMFSI